MFVYGTQYLRGETPKTEQWESDFRNMREMGVNTVRIWLLWNRLEFKEGSIDYDYLDRIFDLGDKYDIKIGCLFHLHACPEWAICKYPQYYYVNGRGISFRPVPRNNTPSGGWPGLCYDNEEVQKMTLDFIKRVVSHVKDRKSLFFWEPMNEPHLFFDDVNGEEYCYCNATVNAFRRWLKTKYGSISVLNESWGRRYGDFSQVFPPTWRVMSRTDWINWRMFSKDNLVYELKRRIDVIKKISEKPVIGHSYGGSQVQNNCLSAMAFDDWDNAGVMDKWGCSGFPYRHSDTAGVSLAMDVTRSSGKDREVWQSELGCGLPGPTLNPAGEITGKQFAMWTWLSIAHGAKGVLYWQYRKERHGVEANSLGMVSVDGSTPNESGKEFIRIADILKKNEGLFLKGEVPKSEVAIVFSPRSYAAYWCENNNTTVPYHCLLGYYNLLWEKNIPCDIIHESYCKKEEVTGYKLIILPFPLALDDKIAEILKDYVYGGGVVLSDPFLCLFDRNFWLDEKNVPGRGFDRIFGVSSKDIFRLTRGKEVTVIADNKKYTVKNSYFVEKYSHSGCDVIASFEDDSPAVTLNRHGKGSGVMCGVNLGLPYCPFANTELEGKKDSSPGSDKELTREVFDKILNASGISSPFPGFPAGVYVRIMKCTGKEDILFLINRTPRKISFGLKLGSLYEHAGNISDSAGKNRLNGNVRLDGYETKIFKLRKPAP